jgi:ABC-type antimicrobial peptide transport system permease subunit
LLGLMLAATAFLFGVSMLFEAFFYGVSVPGYPSVVVGVMVIGGVQLLMIGVLGEYIGKILSELKARPVYFIAQHSIKSAQDRIQDRADAAPTRTAAE